LRRQLPHQIWNSHSFTCQRGVTGTGGAPSGNSGIASIAQLGRRWSNHHQARQPQLVHQIPRAGAGEVHVSLSCRRALVEQPKAVWINRFLTAGFALAARKDKAKRSLRILISAFPFLTIAQVRAGLPHGIGFLDRVSNGLESVGLRFC
jgi:hypothetical protein